jgi:CRP-like cAMP-binding protein
MAEVINRKVVSVGEYVFRQGEQASNAYIVQDGEIQIVRAKDGQETVLGVVGKGGIFGEMGLIDSKPRMASARATKASTVIIVSEAMFREKLAKADPFIRGLLNIFVDTIRRGQK